MSRLATLERTVTVTWQDAKAERQCDVKAIYDYDGDKYFAVMWQEIQNQDGEEFVDVPHGLTEDVFNQMVDDAIFPYINEDYQDWLSGQDDAREY